LSIRYFFSMKTEKTVEFGRRLRYYRLEKDLTQEKLANLTGLNINYIGSVERGERSIGLINIWKLADALEISPTVLFEPISI